MYDMQRMSPLLIGKGWLALLKLHKTAISRCAPVRRMAARSLGASASPDSRADAPDFSIRILAHATVGCPLQSPVGILGFFNFVISLPFPQVTAHRLSFTSPVPKTDCGEFSLVIGTNWQTVDKSMTKYLGA